MSELDEIVDLGALADHRIVHGAAVDRRIGTDLDPVLQDDAADLDKLDHAAFWSRRIAETILADPGTRVDDDFVANQRTHDAGAGGDRAIAPDPHTRTDHGAGCNPRARADMSAGANHGRRFDIDIVLDLRGWIDKGGRRDTARSRQVLFRTHGLRMQDRTGNRKSRVGIACQKNGDVRRGRSQRSSRRK